MLDRNDQMEKVGVKRRSQRVIWLNRWTWINFEWVRITRDWASEEKERRRGKVIEPLFHRETKEDH